MNFENFCKSTTRTFNNQDPSTDLKHTIFGMVEEVGEIAGKFKKNIGYGHKISKSGILEEVGDFMYYFCMTFNILEVAKVEEEGLSGPDIVLRFNALVESIQRPTKVIAGELHTIALSKAVSSLIFNIEEANSSAIVALMENILVITNMLCGSLGKTLAITLEANVDKLKVRYPDKFKLEGTYEKGRNREKELKVVESRTSTPKKD